MRKSVFLLLILAVIAITSVSCASSRKHDRSLEGLMLQENTKLRINREYYSRHNIKTKKDAYKRYKKYRRG